MTHRQTDTQTDTSIQQQSEKFISQFNLTLTMTPTKYRKNNIMIYIRSVQLYMFMLIRCTHRNVCVQNDRRSEAGAGT